MTHFVIQNFGRRARQRVQSVIAQHRQIVAQGHAGQFDAVDNFHRREGVNVHARHRILHGAQNVAVIKRRQTVRQAALNADFGSAQFPRFFRFASHVFERMKIGVGLSRPAAERAKLASHKADIREIDIAIHHVADDVADQVATKRVGCDEQREQVGTIAICQCVALFVT